ncbi:MAG: C25 family cysteine peptidase, partial [Anaerolineales bacterium]|nr:C25 family cysteine peptidase [Anaerolineales bacterium]
APILETPRPLADLNRPAQYLIISHPDFIGGIEPLVQTRQAQGLTVSVVDVNDLYAQYTYGIFDPMAIQQYITYAAQNLGTEYILLVGGDTYDYRNYLGLNSLSFIPSLYVSTGPTVQFIPADPLYADVNNDRTPDLAIGRFPVRTSTELDLIVNKTLAYAGKDYGSTAVFVSDKSDGVSFKNFSNAMLSGLPSDWVTDSIYLDDLSVAAARDQLIAAMNRGTALVTYMGHSSPATWTFSGLFNTSDAAALTNNGRPFVAVQWGCWNTYYVDPTSYNLVQSFLFSGDQGAAAVLGASTITGVNSQYLLGKLLTPRMVTPGMSIGQALRDAKLELAQAHPDFLDVLLGWSLMGDPALVIEP